jgi:hypothetical protein
MSERIVNLFLYVESNLVKNLGAVAHDFDGDDEQAKVFLQSQVPVDASRAIQSPLPVSNIKSWFGVDASQGLPLEVVDYMRRTGTVTFLFEDLLQRLKAPQTPFVCTTYIVDGKPVIESLTHAHPPTDPTIISAEFDGTMKRIDWLAAYLTPAGLNVHDLLHDDFTEAVKFLYAHKHYVSAMKLLVSFIDTVAFLELGDVGGNYQTWLSKYADLTSIDLTSIELWEFRNAILHMTNPLSRKVLSGNVFPLTFFINSPTKSTRINPHDGTKAFSFEALHEVIIEALDKWTKTYSQNFPKQLEFIRRYDTILSEGRIAYLQSKGGIRREAI